MFDSRASQVIRQRDNRIVRWNAESGKFTHVAREHDEPVPRSGGRNDEISFNRRTTPEINGAVSRVSADITTEQRTGASYYTVRVSLRSEEVARLGNVKLVPGMPVEVMMNTGDRKVISYLVKPLQDQFSRAFREN